MKPHISQTAAYVKKSHEVCETHRCRDLLDGYSWCGSPQCSGNTMVVSEAYLGLSWGGYTYVLERKAAMTERKLNKNYFPFTDTGSFSTLFYFTLISKYACYTTNLFHFYTFRWITPAMTSCLMYPCDWLLQKYYAQHYLQWLTQVWFKHNGILLMTLVISTKVCAHVELSIVV